MSTPTVRLSQASHRLLKQLAKQTNLKMVDVLERAIASFQRQLFFERLNAGYAEIRSDAKAWKEVQAERKLWDRTLADGLGSAERWTEDGRCISGAD